MMNTGTIFAAGLISVGLLAWHPENAAAQFPVQFPASLVLETVSLTNLLGQYPNQTGLPGNVTEIKSYLSATSPYSMRLSTATESAISRKIAEQQIKKSGAATTNLHYQINFSPTQFLVETLNYPPGSYALDVWQPVPEGAKIRSDGFFGGKYFVKMPGGVLSEMTFGNLDAFKAACMSLMQTPGPPQGHNAVLDQGGIDFRQYARFQNLGHDGIVPGSFVFTGNDFICSGIRGDDITGFIHTNASGLVDGIFFNGSKNYGPHSFLLCYETAFTNAAWYPSRIVDAKKRKDGLYDVMQIHTVHNAFAVQNTNLSIPTSAADLYQPLEKSPAHDSYTAKFAAVFTNFSSQLFESATHPAGQRDPNTPRQYEWDRNMAYELVGTQLVARPSLVK